MHSKGAVANTKKVLSPSVNKKVKNKENKSLSISKDTHSNDSTINIASLLRSQSPKRDFNVETYSKASLQTTSCLSNQHQASSVDFKKYFQNYSQQLRYNVKQKVSYSLSFEIKKSLAEYRKQLTTSILKNLGGLHQELFTSMKELSGTNNNYTSIISRYQSVFESSLGQLALSLISSSKDQNFMDSFYIESSELDAMLIKEAEDKVSNTEKQIAHPEEVETSEYFKAQLTQDLRESFTAINNVVAHEFSKMSSQFRSILNEDVNLSFHKLIEGFKNSTNEVIDSQRSLPIGLQDFGIDSHLLEDQFPESIENLPKQQPVEISDIELRTEREIGVSDSQITAQTKCAPKVTRL